MTLHVQRNSTRRKHVIIIILVCAAFAGLGYVAWSLYRATYESNSFVTGKVINYSTAQPSENKPTEACNEYTTDDAMPERINISAIGVSGCILQVGIDQHNAIAVPDNIYVAGWYIRSSPPGKPGLSVINGHMSGQYKVDALFQHVDRLKAGDSFTITLGSGKVLTYEIYKTQTVQLDVSARVVLDKDPNVSSQLNLITCGGQYDKNSKFYDQRIIVSAALR